MELNVHGRRAWAYTGGRPFDPALPCVVFLHGAAESPPDVPVLHLVLGNLYTLTGLAVIIVLAVTHLPDGWRRRLGARERPPSRSRRPRRAVSS